jgi:hypothetical protein
MKSLPGADRKAHREVMRVRIVTITIQTSKVTITLVRGDETVVVEIPILG